MEKVFKVSIEEARKELPIGWAILANLENISYIKRHFDFNSYLDGVNFVTEVAKVAEGMNHHPDITIRFRKVDIEIFTHSHKGLTNLDVSFAIQIENLYISFNKSNF
ncbi:4a-hydroxytetrahydrobiopterin dehydratase [Leptospira perolatii]|uniref:4a-hydroxytetrahydrobiopterin dehydratase n=1 Tax=Leptospira perolatii TaxID=2023191 RepID=UPI0013FD9AAA